MGEHVDLSDLGLVGAQLALVQAVKQARKPMIVVFVSGKPMAEPWIQAHAGCCHSAILPCVGTTPAFYNYLKGSRPIDLGFVLDDGTLRFGHQYVLDTPIPLRSFGHGLNYTTFN
ncbi:hypothetical protein C0995_011713, partial [Termitomyces sp. Mi166